MELVPRSAFGRGLFPLQRQMNRLFEDFFGDSNAPQTWGRGRWAPEMDIAETEEEYLVSAEVPGVSKDDLDITVTGNLLTVEGEKKTGEDSEEGRPQRRERTFGRFSRTISLPESVDASNVEASAKDGILTIRLAKKEQAKPRKIEIGVDQAV